MVLTRTGTGLERVVRVHEPTTGRTMEMATTQPGVQFYTGNFLDGTITGKGGKVYPKRSGFCLETQHYPGLAQQAGVPLDDPEAGRDLQAEHGVHVRGALRWQFEIRNVKLWW